MTEMDAFMALAQAYFEDVYKAMPVLATELGIHTYDHLLGDFSAAGWSGYADMVQRYQQRLAAIRRDRLDLLSAHDYDLMACSQRMVLLWLQEEREWQRNPGFYAEYPLFGLFLLMSREFAPLPERMANVLSRLKLVPGVLEEAKANLNNPPRVWTETAIETVEGGLQFYEQIIPALAVQVPSLQADLLAANQAAIAAMRDYLTWLRQTLLPRSTGDFRLGRRLFEEHLHSDFMLDMTADDLRTTGWRVFNDTKARLEEQARAINPAVPWPRLIEEARQAHPRGDELLEAYRRELASLRRFLLERDLVTIPAGEELEVVETPPFQRSLIPYAAYMPPAPFEPQQKGQFWVTPLDMGASPEQQEHQLQEHCRHSVILTSVHEALPGHHLQLVFANRSSSYVRRNLGHTSLFAEGWALYCEQLMGENGYYTDPLTLLFQLKDQLWRAARIIVDVGLHCDTMSIEEAEGFLIDEVKLTPAAARTEVRRYTQSPTQPSSYMLGKLEILKLRDAYGHLPQKVFHDTLLSSGTVPLKIAAGEMAARLGTGVS